MDCRYWGFIEGTEKPRDDSVKYKKKRDYNLRMTEHLLPYN